ncbi:hypothetical protein MYX82_11530 [Acidobacteria bacterium AH-259-D05]|nr:hypothetical protein [Acidobacteria bacterium AH-259-D05]
MTILTVLGYLILLLLAEAAKCRSRLGPQRLRSETTTVVHRSRETVAYCRRPATVSRVLRDGVPGALE